MNPQRKKRWMPGILLIPSILLFLTVELILAQSSENYQIKKSTINQGGARSQSANYNVVDAVGQSAVGTASSENYSVSSGFFGEYESGSTAVDEDVGIDLPEKFKLFQNYPNPFNPVTHIKYHLPHTAEVELTIFDIQGLEVYKIVHGIISAGSHTTVWDGKDMAGKIVSSGIYFYRIAIKANEARQQSYLDIKKMILMK